MAATTSDNNRDHPYYHVRDLTIKVVQRPPSPLNSDDLQTLGVEVTGMDIATGKPADSGPQFCDLYPLREFDSIFEKVDEWPQQRATGSYKAAYQIRQLIEKSLIQGGLASKSKYVWRRLRKNIPFENLNRVTGRRGPISFARGVFDTFDTSTPHLGTIVIDASDSDDRLRWSELLWATALMASRLQDGCFQAHKIAPVFVYSIAGRNARVIQAHYDKGKFIVRKTEHISFEDENFDNLKLFLRWIMNIPKGKTDSRSLRQTFFRLCQIFFELCQIFFQLIISMIPFGVSGKTV